MSKNKVSKVAQLEKYHSEVESFMLQAGLSIVDVPDGLDNYSDFVNLSEQVDNLVKEFYGYVMEAKCQLLQENQS